MIRVLLGQSDMLFRGALAAVLSEESDLTIVGEVARWDEALATATRTRPDVAVLDFALPAAVDGAVAQRCRALCRALPASGVLIVLDRHADANAGRSLIDLAPQVGLIDTEASPAELIAAVRRLAQGGPVLDADLAVAVLFAGNNPLTERERDVLRLARDGTPTKEIARKLYLSVGTVRNYLSRVVLKTGARTRLEAIRVAQESGWI